MNEEQLIKEFRERFSSEWWNGFGTTEDINKLGIESIEQFWLSVLAVEIKKAEARGRNDAVDYVNDQITTVMGDVVDKLELSEILKEALNLI
jgi:hypothetical protein